MRLRHTCSPAAAAGILLCGVLLMTGCGVASTAPSSTSSGTGSNSAGSGTGSGSGAAGPAAGPASLSFPDQGGTIAELPSSYVRGVPNRWVLYFHGYNENASSILGGNYQETETTLLAAGYVVIGMTNTTQNCYGNPQCNSDIAAVAKLYQSQLSLEAEPFVVADSMGGFTVLNGISSGAFHPRAVVGWSINTNLAWDFTDGGALSPITADYSISDTNSYAVATAGYDPMLQGGAVYAHTPFQLWASYSDTVVLRPLNTDLFATMVTASGGDVVVNTASGQHMSSSNFDPAAVVAFFDAH